MTPAESFDVVVVGGGSAGIAASVTAACCGARTLLVESSDRLGGNATNAFVHTICGLYESAEHGLAYAHPGFPRRFAEGLLSAGGAAPAERAGRVYVLPTFPPRFASFARELCARAVNLEVWLGSPVIAAHLADTAGDSVLGVQSGAGRVDVRADVVIDTSGDAVAGHLGGADRRMAAPAELQSPSFIFRMSGVDTAEIHGFGRLRVSHAVAGAVRAGELPEGCESVLVRPAGEAGDVYVTLNVPKLAGRPFAPLDESYRRDLEKHARFCAEQVAAHLQATRPAFRDSRVTAWPPRIGIRETRRLRGIVEMEKEALLCGVRRDDEVARSTWPIELWHDHRRARFEYPAAAASVPLGALISRSHARLGMAGRCMSATHEALGALRVIGTSMATGEAIGAAAALASDARTTLPQVAPAAVRRQILLLAENPG